MSTGPIKAGPEAGNASLTRLPGAAGCRLEPLQCACACAQPLRSSKMPGLTIAIRALACTMLATDVGPFLIGGLRG